MTQNSFGRTVRGDLPDPETAPVLFEEVLMRRIIAFAIDSVIMSAMTVIAAVVLAIAGIVTFGVA